MQIHDPDEFAQTELAQYMDDARIALTISSCNGGDHALLHVNERFCEMTGYTREQSVGRNCRFLQRGMREQDARFRMRRFIRSDDRSYLRCALVNFRADGSPFVNLIYLSELRSADREQCYIFASQFDATKRHIDILAEYDRELAKATEGFGRIAGEFELMMDQSIDAVAHTAASIAETKLALRQLSELDG